jgi:hypothetical protein
MDLWSGPSLWSFNDSVFRPEDLDNLRTVANCGKMGDPTKTGKYGLQQYFFFVAYFV